MRFVQDPLLACCSTRAECLAGFLPGSKRNDRYRFCHTPAVCARRTQRLARHEFGQALKRVRMGLSIVEQPLLGFIDH